MSEPVEPHTKPRTIATDLCLPHAGVCVQLVLLSIHLPPRIPHNTAGPRVLSFSLSLAFGACFSLHSTESYVCLLPTPTNCLRGRGRQVLHLDSLSIPGNPVCSRLNLRVKGLSVSYVPRNPVWVYLSCALKSLSLYILPIICLLLFDLRRETL